MTLTLSLAVVIILIAIAVIGGKLNGLADGLDREFAKLHKRLDEIDRQR